ncbi:hypothetical protein T12_10368 [Trichinella patagoniensis]|uniref:Uncharacterized protein n=1 Tax=Trichinella patagoniensis TaxID=990121 RepID=A0A0V0ZIT2_9BILA|nr:hypothetical protein T12_10368 [Trichinella patagoniensis]
MPVNLQTNHVNCTDQSDADVDKALVNFLLNEQHEQACSLSNECMLMNTGIETFRLEFKYRIVIGACWLVLVSIICINNFRKHISVFKETKNNIYNWDK